MTFVPLYDAETLSTFKQDPIFDVKFIQYKLGLVGTTFIPCIEKDVHNGIGGSEVTFKEETYPIVYSDVYSTEWWRIKSPSRFAEVPNHDPELYGANVLDQPCNPN